MLPEGMGELGQDSCDRWKNPRLIIILCGRLPYQQQDHRPGDPAKQFRDVPGFIDFQFFFAQVSFSLVLTVTSHRPSRQLARGPVLEVYF